MQLMATRSLLRIVCRHTIPRYQTLGYHNIHQEGLRHQISQQDHHIPHLRLR